MASRDLAPKTRVDQRTKTLTILLPYAINDVIVMTTRILVRGLPPGWFEQNGETEFTFTADESLDRSKEKP